MKQIAANRMFVGFHPPRNMERSDRPVKIKKPRTGGITET